MTLPSNFGRAIDLSALGKPAVTQSALPGREVNSTNFAGEFLSMSRQRPVILACWSTRNPESIKVVEILATLHANDADRWTLGRVNVDVETQLSQALVV